MAIMYPDKPKEITPGSHEDIMFEALKKLPDSYYVFHSFSIVSIKDGIIYESETDFIVFNPSKGIICIEAKAGDVKYEDGQWKYGNNIIMSHDGPFNQASSNKWKLMSYIQNNNLSYILSKCKILHAVWFPSILREKINNINLPPEADKNLILTNDSLYNIEEDIEKIFNIELPNGIHTNLDNNDTKLLLNNILAPSFNLISLSEMNANHNRLVFKKMTEEQIALLNYLDEQNNAIINGMAGTGKTVMAIEKAKRHASAGEDVLFLCYNNNLKNYLKNTYNDEKIHFYTIDGLACHLCNTSIPDYLLLKECLENMYYSNSFPFQHVIIDEGQDFGKENIEESNIIELLKLNTIDDENKNGTFYLFYDKNQMIQSSKVPSYIQDSDCKLTLYKNCRNTINIARTSLRLLGNDKSPKMFDGAILGHSPRMYCESDKIRTIEKINNIIDEITNLQYKNIQILTCRTEEQSIIKDECYGDKYFYNGKCISFSTCRKFKGLEAEAVILIDVDENMLDSNMEQLLYVGSSRAKYELYIISNLTEDKCNDVIEKLHLRRGNNPYKTLATALNARYLE